MQLRLGELPRHPARAASPQKKTNQASFVATSFTISLTTRSVIAQSFSISDRHSSFVRPSFCCSRPNNSSSLPSEKVRSSSVNCPYFCFNLPVTSFQLPLSSNFVAIHL